MYIESIKKLLFIYLNFAPLQTQAYSYIRFNDHGGFQIKKKSLKNRKDEKLQKTPKNCSLRHTAYIYTYLALC